MTALTKAAFRRQAEIPLIVLCRFPRPALSDGRYVAAHIEGLGQPQTPTAAELPAKSVAHLEEMWAQITRGLKR